MLSLLPGDQLPDIKVEWFSIDTAVHGIMYFALSVFFLIGFVPQEKKRQKKLNLSDLKVYLWIIVVGILIGYFVELIQGNWIYRRYYDVTDVVANSFGTIFGAFAYGWTGRKLI